MGTSVAESATLDYGYHSRDSSLAGRANRALPAGGELFSGPFAGASEDRPPRVLSPISPPVLASCARSGGPIGATRGGKPSEAERGPENSPSTPTMAALGFSACFI